MIIEVDNLQKAYGNLKAVDGISFSVEEGEIFGILGPNGAGKTTAVECIEGIRKPDSGRVKIMGLDPQKDAIKIKELTGIQLQESMLPDRIKVKEALHLFGSFYQHHVNTDTLLDEFGLSDKRNAMFDKLSGGQKQRLSIAMALVNDPKVVFFDELTTGLDPQARRATWEKIKRVRDMGKTVVLVTHFMDEAEYLCNRIAVVDYGKIIALDTPKNLIKKYGMGIRISFKNTSSQVIEKLKLAKGISDLELNGKDVELRAGTMYEVAKIIQLLADDEDALEDFDLKQSTLEDVFIQLTGRNIRA